MNAHVVALREKKNKSDKGRFKGNLSILNKNLHP
jgi:hypothetical protein